jgi:hypothetical protein
MNAQVINNGEALSFRLQRAPRDSNGFSLDKNEPRLIYKPLEPQSTSIR